ncbi:MAG: hypothetical protein ACYC2G_09585 [Gemmatimonadaceae bacterium]
MSVRFTSSMVLRIGLAIVAGALLGDVANRLVGERWWWLPWVLMAVFWLFVLHRHRRRGRREPTTTTRPGAGDAAA